MNDNVEKFYDRNMKILNINGIELLHMEDVARDLMNFVTENYDFIESCIDDWYDLSYDIDVIKEIPSLNTLNVEEKQLYIQSLLRYDNSGELLISRYAWMIGLTRIVLYHKEVLQYEQKRLDNLASAFADSIPEDMKKAGELITDFVLYENIILRKEPFMKDDSAIKFAKEEMIEIYDAEHQHGKVN